MLTAVHAISPLSSSSSQHLSDDLWTAAHSLLAQATWIHFAQTSVRIGFIVLFCYGLMRVINHIAHMCEVKLLPAYDRSAPLKTILPIIKSVFRWILFTLTFLLILSELGINIMPLLYSLGVISLAFGLGAQALVKDFINGLMNLLEGSMAVGDYVTLAGHTGTVESLSLRCVHIKDDYGLMHIIPFSEVKAVVNASQRDNFLTIHLILEPFDKFEIVEDVFRSLNLWIQSNQKIKSWTKESLLLKGISHTDEYGVHIKASIQVDQLYASVLSYTLYNQLIPTCQEAGLRLVHKGNV